MFGLVTFGKIMSDDFAKALNLFRITVSLLIFIVALNLSKLGPFAFIVAIIV